MSGSCNDNPIYMKQFNICTINSKASASEFRGNLEEFRESLDEIIDDFRTAVYSWHTNHYHLVQLENLSTKCFPVSHSSNKCVMNND